MSVIKQLVGDSELSRITLMQDFPEFNSRLFIKCLVKDCQDFFNDCDIHVICSETPARYYNDCFEIGNSRIKISDTLMCTAQMPSENAQNILPFAIDSSIDEKTVYIFDSITPMLIRHNATKLCRTFERILRCKPTSSIIFMVHSDVHSPEEIAMLELQANTILKFEQSRSCNSVKCLVTQKKMSGKVSKHVKRFNLDVTSSIHGIMNVEGLETNLKPKRSNDETDPTANLSFNLSLKPNELEAREKLVLPFTKTDKERNDGKIIYHHDDVDDYDEEDPDDDLDI